MSNVNMVALSGRLGRDPEVKYTAGGVAIASFSIAVQGYRKDAEEPPVSWVDIKAFGKLAEVVAGRVAKGGRIFVNGEIFQEKWKGRDQKNKTRLVIHARLIEIIDWTDDQHQPLAKTPSPDYENPPTPGPGGPAPDRSHPADHGEAPAADTGPPGGFEYDDIPF